MFNVIVVYNQQEPFTTTNYGGILKNGKIFIIILIESYDIELFYQLNQSDVNVNYFKSIKPEERDISKGITIETCVDTITSKDFEYIQVLKRGYTFKLTEVKYKKNGKTYAMKTVKKSRLKDDLSVDHIQTERYIYEKIHHPFLNQLHFSFQTQYKLYMIIDWYNKGSLEYYIAQRKGFNEEEAKFYLAQVYLLLEYLHSKDIIFRELSSGNVYLTSNGYIKIFEISQAKANIPHYTSGTKSVCGLPEYRGPDMIKTEKSDVKDNEVSYGKAVDVWSMGILLYEMLYGQVPFSDMNKDMVHKKIIFNSPDFRDNVPISAEAQDLILKILEKNKTQRIRLPQIKEHQFFKGVDFDMIYQMKAKPMIIPEAEDDNIYLNDDYINDNPNDSLYTGCSPIMKEHFEKFSFNEDMK